MPSDHWLEGDANPEKPESLGRVAPHRIVELLQEAIEGCGELSLEGMEVVAAASEAKLRFNALVAAESWTLRVVLWSANLGRLSGDVELCHWLSVDELELCHVALR